MTRSIATGAFVTAVGATPSLPVALAGAPPATPRVPPHEPHRYRFFDADEAQFVEAACERLIPADDTGSGATAAGVPGYLDQQLAEPWGAGTLLYRMGPWQPGTPIPSAHPARSPAELFRATLAAINRRLESHGTPFTRLSGPAQDALLAALQTGNARLPGIPTQAFFALLLAMTLEGFFSHPVHGARRDRIAWRLEGFPGAHAPSPG